MFVQLDASGSTSGKEVQMDRSKPIRLD